MHLYEIYQSVAMGISISCLVGLAVAWILFLSNRKKWIPPPLGLLHLKEQQLTYWQLLTTEAPTDRRFMHLFWFFYFLFLLFFNMRSFFFQPLPQTALSLRRSKIRKVTITFKIDLLFKFWRSSPMQLYEIIKVLLWGTSASCVIGLMVAWIFFLSNRKK